MDGPQINHRRPNEWEPGVTTPFCSDKFRHSENKLKINFDPLLALTLLHVWRGGTRAHASYLLEPLIVAAPSALSAILAEVRVKVESSDSLVVS